jgi:hypothetical protein
LQIEEKNIGACISPLKPISARWIDFIKKGEDIEDKIPLR